MTEAGLSRPSFERRLGRTGLARPRLRPKLSNVLPALTLVAVTVVLVLVPLLALSATSLEWGLDRMVFTLMSAGGVMAASVGVSVAATFLAVAAGLLLAMATERAPIHGRRALRLVLVLAFLVPGYVAALGWVAAYAPGGLLDDLLGLAAPALHGPVGVAVVLGMEAMPIAYLIVAVGLASHAEPDLERAARASGAGAVTVLRTITLPLMRPIIAAAAAITFVLSITSFGVPAILGIPAGFTTMTTRIYRDLTLASDPDAFSRAITLASMLAVIVVTVVASSGWLLRRRRAVRSGQPGGPSGSSSFSASVASGTMEQSGYVGSSGPRDRARMTGWLISLAAWLSVVLLILVPLAGLLVTALLAAPGLDPVPANFTLDNFRSALGPGTLSALANSTLLSVAAAAGVVLLAGLAAMTRRGRGAAAAGSLTSLTFALPGSTLAVAILLAYGIALRDTLLIILIAYLAKFWAIGYGPVAAGLDGVAADGERAARASGASGLTAARTVVLPMLRPMLVAAGLIVFVFGLHEVTMSSLLYGPGSATLAVIVLNLQQLGDPHVTAALALALTLMLSVAALPLLSRLDRLPGLRWRR